MVHFQVLHRTTLLTPPSVAVEHLEPQDAIRPLIQLQSSLFSKEFSHKRQLWHLQLLYPAEFANYILRVRCPEDLRPQGSRRKKPFQSSDRCHRCPRLFFPPSIQITVAIWNES